MPTSAAASEATSAAANLDGSLSSLSRSSHAHVVSRKAWGNSASSVVFPAPAGAEIKVRRASEKDLARNSIKRGRRSASCRRAGADNFVTASQAADGCGAILVRLILSHRSFGLDRREEND